MSSALRCVLIVLGGYLLGSFSTGLLISRLTHGPDLYHVGSGNTGATNVQRVMGTKEGIIVFLGDYLKAVLACLIGLWISGCVYGAMLAGLLVVIGHNWPAFFGFRGGKGVSCSIAVMLVCFPIPALLCYALGIALIAIWRYVSLGSMTVLLSYALMMTFLGAGGDWLIIAWVWLLTVLCFARHRENIGRLINGTERKLGEKVRS